MPLPYPIRFSVDYPERDLDRLSSFFRLLTVLPIAFVLALISGGESIGVSDEGIRVLGGGGLLFLPPLLLILFRQKYPRWWFDWNVELLRFSNRVLAYLFLMRDEYPSTDEEQAVHLEVPYPQVGTDLNQFLPLVKWFLAIPHYIVLMILYLCLIPVLVITWFAILFTGRYPRDLFHFAEGVMRWSNRVIAYAFILVTDVYPPFGWEEPEIGEPETPPIRL